MEEQNITEETLTKRPLGVKILTIYFSLFAGLFPMGLVIIMFFNSPAEISIPIYQLILSTVLGCAIIYSSIVAWKGKEWAPKILIAFLAVHYILLAWNNYNMLQGGQIEGIRAWSRILRTPIMIGIATWYFLFSKSKKFYKS